VSDVTLNKIQVLVQKQQYELSSHVRDSLAEGDFDIEDIEYSILYGTIVIRQRDEIKVAIDGKKYVIAGPTKSGLPFETVGKVIHGYEEQVYFIITAYQRR
jgi:hypothetical protein